MVAQTSAKADGTSMFRLILAVLVLLARLLGAGIPTASAQTAPVDFAGLEGAAICHGSGVPNGSAGQDPSKAPAHDHACLLCSACFMAGPAVLPPSCDVPLLVPARLPGRAALPPPATGPPHPARAATPPTGPPAHPV